MLGTAHFILRVDHWLIKPPGWHGGWAYPNDSLWPGLKKANRNPGFSMVVFSLAPNFLGGFKDPKPSTSWPKTGTGTFGCNPQTGYEAATYHRDPCVLDSVLAGGNLQFDDFPRYKPPFCWFPIAMFGWGYPKHMSKHSNFDGRHGEYCILRT